ncbi:MAG: hypothetical protein U0930_10790 [Pirellulales bacterium]
MLSLKSQSSLLKNRWLWGILMIAFLLRLGAVVYWHRSANTENGFFRLGDSDGYWVLATHIARGEPYQYGSENASVFRAPLMPLFLSTFTYIEDRSTAVFLARVAGAVLGTITVLLIALLARQLSCLAIRVISPCEQTAPRVDNNNQTLSALLAALLCAVHPSAIGMSIVVLSEMIFVPLMLVYLLLWSRWLPAVIGLNREPWKRPGSNSDAKVDVKSSVTSSRVATGFAVLQLLTGIVGGLATLARPSWLLFSPFVLVLGLCLVNQRLQYLKAMLIVGAGMSLAMSPWWIRNFVVTDKFVLTTLQVGPSLYDSFHGGASGGSDEGMQFMRRIEAEQAEEDHLMLEAAPEKPLESTFSGDQSPGLTRSRQWCNQNPTQVLKLRMGEAQ